MVGLILVLSTLATGCFPTWEPFPDFGVPTDRLLESGAVGRLRKQGLFVALLLDRRRWSREVAVLS